MLNINISKLSNGDEMPLNVVIPVKLPISLDENEQEVLVRFEGSLVGLDDVFTLKGHASFDVKLNCCNCLREILENVSFEVFEKLSNKVSLDDLNFSSFVGHEISLDDIIYTNLCMNYPTKVSCTDDCKGLCSVCGNNLNESECDCTVVRNPVFENYLKTLKDKEEV